MSEEEQPTDPTVICMQIDEQNEYIKSQKEHIEKCKECIRDCENKIAFHTKRIEFIQRDILHWKFEIATFEQFIKEEREVVEQLENVLHERPWRKSKEENNE